MPRLLIWSILILSLLLAGCSTRKPPVPTPPATAEALGAWEGRPSANYEAAVVVNLDEMEGDASAAWLGYLLARSQWIDDNLVVAQPEEFLNYTPRFEEELTGRWAMTQIWGGLREKGAQPDDYLDALTLIEEKGFLKPYVWRYHYQDHWGPRPNDLPWVRFDQWMTQRLPEFQPVTRGSIKLVEPGTTARKAQEAQLAQKQAAK